ncbi:serine incorporator 1-like [Polypterus senegalus]|uniref:serine incorporator 1-like n=1 Tax=Polypterus senegalus TaxID=55291 RepID=UPI0019640874|nr:serine incorporator 1-like [Polypterus senegalus]
MSLIEAAQHHKEPAAVLLLPADQTRFWCFKGAAIIILFSVSFCIPEEFFSKALFIIGAAGALGFVLIQLVVLIDVGYFLNLMWEKKTTEGGSRCWHIAVLAATCLNYMLSLVTAIICFIFYASGSCIQKTFFIIFNGLICVLASIISLHPKVQELQSGSGLLQSSLITLYVLYLTWSAMTNMPVNASKLIVQQDDDPKHTTKGTQQFVKAKLWRNLGWESQSPDLNPAEEKT